jgi:prevent-host-death family protein
MAPIVPPIRLRLTPDQPSSFWSKLTRMTSIAVAEAKARFSELIDRASRGERFLVLRHGRPAAALVPAPSPLEEPEPAPATTGLASLAGIVDWEEFPAVMEEVVADRQLGQDRPAPTFD